MVWTSDELKDWAPLPAEVDEPVVAPPNRLASADAAAKIRIAASTSDRVEVAA
jgi:hypothetical protein